MSNEDNEKILDKIKKMLALAKSDNRHESAQALKMAQRLMEKHQLSMGDVHISQIKTTRVKSRFSVSKPKSYEVILMRAVERAFGVAIAWLASESWVRLVGEDNYAQFTIIGPEDQIEIASYTAEVMSRKMVSARKGYIKQLKDEGFRGRELTHEANAFCDGWAVSVMEKIHQFANPKEVTDAIAEKKKLIIEDRKADIQTSEGSYYSQTVGRKAGSEESIYRPVNEKKRAKLAHS